MAIENLKFKKVTSLPAAIVANKGTIYFNDTDKTINICNGTSYSTYKGTDTNTWPSTYAASSSAGGNATKSDSIATDVATSNSYRDVFFAWDGDKTKVVYDDDFQYNPSTNTLKIGSGTLTASAYSGNAATATKLGTTTIGSSTLPIYLNSGTPAAITGLGEAHLSWGGRNFNGSYGCIDAAMVSDLGANRFAFLYPDGIDIEYTRNGGSTWTSYGASNSSKQGLFSLKNGGDFRTTGPGSTTEIRALQNDINAHPENYMLRVTIRTGAAGIYTVINKLIIYVTTDGSGSTWCSLDVRTEANRTSNINTWVNIINKGRVSGWSGYNVFNISGTCTYGNTASSQYGEWRFTFGQDTYNPGKKSDGSWNDYFGLRINSIFGFGGVGWSTPSTMAATGHLYSYDGSQNAFFPAGVSCSSLTVGGTNVSLSGHTHTTANITSLSGYSKASSYSAVSSSDSLNTALGKLSAAVDGVETLLAAI